jgi:tetratricopeptide (TPR) repeat protein
MPTIVEVLKAALKLHQSGNLDEAERLYREVLQANDHNADAWHLLGHVAFARGDAATATGHIEHAIALDGAQSNFHHHLADMYASQGRFSEAEACCRQALRLKDNSAAAHHTLGTVLMRQGKLDPAIDSYRQAVAHQPDFAIAYNNLGAALRERGNIAEAVHAYHQALRLDPCLALAHYNLGVALQSCSQTSEAIACYERALAIQPGYAEALCNLGRAFNDQGQTAKAVECFQRALQQQPNLAEAHCLLGVVFQNQGHLAKAAECYRQAIHAKPDYGDAYNNLGTVYRAEHQYAEAIECYQLALEFRPNFAEALTNLGHVYKVQGRVPDAAVCYDQSLRIDPRHPMARYSRAVMLLAAGDFSRGWVEYESRFECSGFPRRSFSKPVWNGAPLGGRTLLVHAEQALGDAIQFARYVKLLDQDSGKVFFEIPEPLLKLFEQSGFRNLVVRDQAHADFDMHLPLLSLPRVLGTTLESIPAPIPYLSADPQRVASWGRELGRSKDFKVGIAWQGSTAYLGDRFRSISLTHFAPLAQQGVELVSLQKGAGVEQLANVAGQFQVRDFGASLDREHGPFMDTAAIMKNLDLVVTSDTAVAHLAGALGVNVWVALPLSPDWRWMYDRSDSPWYPTMRLFRQTKFDDWPSVFARLAEALRLEVVRRR